MDGVVVAASVVTIGHGRLVERVDRTGGTGMTVVLGVRMMTVAAGGVASIVGARATGVAVAAMSAGGALRGRTGPSGPIASGDRPSRNCRRMRTRESWTGRCEPSCAP